jgi:predicted nucleotidyltransferase
MISFEKEICDLLGIAKETKDSFLLYGSYARGDYDSNSDIDVLRITTNRIPANRLNGHLSVYVYAIKDLLAMARHGNLFILHLLREAKPLHDPHSYLERLGDTFEKPQSYAVEACKWVRPATPLLDINESLFMTAPRPFMSSAIFLCRTLLYGDHADRGPLCFSLSSLASQDATASLLYDVKRRSTSYVDFCNVSKIIYQRLGCRPAPTTASTVEELVERGVGYSLFDSLLRRVVEDVSGDPYLITSPLEISKEQIIGLV